MNKILKLALVSVAGLSITALSAKAATYTAGDLLLGFYTTDGSSSNTYMFNLGQASTYRDNPSVGLIADIHLDLETAFGAGWQNNTALSWGIIGNNNSAPSGTVVSGDAVRTIYASQSGNINGTQATAITLNSTSRGSSANQIQSLIGAYSAATGTGNGGAILATSATNTWEEFNTSGVGAASFSNIQPVIYQNFTASTLGSFGGVSNVEGILDLQRIVNSNPGGAVAGTIGSGVYETSFVIDSTGNVSAVPEPSTYALLGLTALAFAAFRRRKLAA